MDSPYHGGGKGRGRGFGGRGGREGRQSDNYVGGRGRGGNDRGGRGGRGRGGGGGGRGGWREGREGSPGGRGGSNGSGRKAPDLWTFLPNDNQFRTQFQMLMFVRAMEAHDASDLVIVLANDKLYGRKKVVSICEEAVACGPARSVSAGNHGQSVPFQGVVLPMLRVISQPEFYNNPASSKVNTTLASMAEVEGLQEYLVSCMRLLTQRGTTRDLGKEESEDDGVKDWDVAFHIVISFFNLTMDRFYSLFDAAQAGQDMQELQAMLEKWQGEKPVHDGKYHSLRSAIYRLRQSLDRRCHSERQRQRAEEGQKLHEEFFPSGQRISSMQAVDGPGELSLAGHPRHDNDHVEISAISVAPTMQEVLCKTSPYLPHNHPNESHHLPPGSVGRHVDIQFRLLRHDLIAPLWNKALFLFERFKHEGGSGAGSRVNSSSSGGGRGGEVGGLVRAERGLVRGLAEDMKGVVGFSSEDMDVYLLRDVHVLSVNTDKRSGVYFLIDFLEPPMPRGRRARNRVEFWENTRRLQNGALVCLWIRRGAAARRGNPGAAVGSEDVGSHQLVFATITARDTKKLASPRPQIGVQPCQGNGFSTDLLALIGQGGGGAGEARRQVVMLEAHGSFFAYEPILKALQKINEASLPFAEYICGAAGSPGAAGGAGGTVMGRKVPAYMQGGMIYDLSLLLKTKPVSSRAETAASAEDLFSIRNVMISHPNAFPRDALLRCTSLDQPQAVAVQAGLTQEFALLQGPPGTGKTFVGIKLVEILLSNALKRPGGVGGSTARGTVRQQAGSSGATPMGPILCVCFTNHALDQFLEGIIASGIKNVVRVGGRSKSDSLQEYNLFNIIRNSNPHQSRTYRDSSFEVRNRLRELEAVIGQYSDALQQRRDNLRAVPWRSISSHLMVNHPVFFHAFDPSHKTNEDGFQRVGLDDWERWKQGQPKDGFQRRRKKTASGLSNLWGDQGAAAVGGGHAGGGGGGSRAGETAGAVRGVAGRAGGVAREVVGGMAAPVREAHIGNAFGALSLLGDVEVADGWLTSGGRDGRGVGEEFRKLVGLMDYFSDVEDASTGAPIGAATGAGAGAGIRAGPATGHAFGESELGGQGGQGGQQLGYSVEVISQAFGDLAVQTTASSAQGSSNSGRGGGRREGQQNRQGEGGRGILEEPLLETPEVDERSDRGVRDLLCVGDPWMTSAKEREKLLEHWVGELRATANAAIESEVNNFARKVAERRELQEMEELAILKNAQVVGMTTSGVAKMQRLITALGPPVILVEEAAEVLEAHILTSLSPNTQHVILIGDHLQLRPKVEVYELSKDSRRAFDLDVSLFERLALSGHIPFYTLETQRRMRPEIADLIRRTLYPQLRDHPCVQQYPDVRGMDCNLLLWDHDHPESGGDDLNDAKSKTNEGEVAMVVGLARYLLQQGYAGGEVTILTPYVGQLLKLRQALAQVASVRLGEGDIEVVQQADEKAEVAGGGGEGTEGEGEERAGVWGSGLGSGMGQGKKGGVGLVAPKATTANLKDSVRLATVDNFQGEESTVVIISLVRNNPDGRIGFLKSPNRANVLLSRAKHGMYIIGNANTMRANPKSVLWPLVLDILESRGRIQRSVPLRCVNHPDTVTHIHTAREFIEKASEGGCSQMCGFRLPCGHTCPRRCHGDDRAHASAFCPKECSRIRPVEECRYQHTCPKQCGAPCGACTITIKALPLPCGHQAFNVPCFKAHTPSSIFCGAMVEVTMPLCGHKQAVKCSEATTRLTSPKLCTARCGIVLSDSCGHTCGSPCGECIVAPTGDISGTQNQLQQQGQFQQPQQQELPVRKHKKCTQPCKRSLPCGHLCPDTCHISRACKPCTRKCLVTCQHSSCPLPCHRTCAPCAEPCTWRCKHQGSCSLPCGSPCDRLPCDRRCEKRLPCGHQCPSLCGEKCPSRAFCVMPGCGAEEKRGMTVDLVTLESLGEIDPDESPILVLPCGHAYTVDTLDGHLELSQVYLQAEESPGGGKGEGDGSGGSRWVAVLPFEDRNLSTLKGCPECRQPITGFRRYGRMVNKTLLDQSERKFALTCLADQRNFQKRLSRLGQAVASCSGDAIPTQLQELAQAAVNLVHETNTLRITSMDPPTQRTYQASIAALQRKHLLLGPASSDGDSSACDEENPSWELECQLLYVPQPDPRPLCEALMMLGKAYQLLMAVNFLQLRSLLRNLCDESGRSSESSSGKVAYLMRNVGQCRAVIQAALRSAEGHVGEAVEWAGRRKAHRLEARARLELVDVLRAFVEGTMAERLLSNNPADIVGAEKKQLEYIEKAKVQCGAVARHHLSAVRDDDTLGKSALTLLNQDLKALEKSVRDGPRYFSLTEREKGDIFKAVGLGGGHWFRCRNGHVYAIGECGGAMEESRCPECGEVVGGSQHRLREGNSQADDFFTRS